MKLRHSKHLIVAALVAVAIAVVAGGEAQASNMGFKFNKTINSNAGGFPNGVHTLALPFQHPYTNFADICGALAMVAPSTIVQYDTTNNGLPRSYTCGDASPALVLPHLGFEVTSTTATGGIVVGSHRPGSSVYRIAGPFSYPAGNNIIAIPYHSSAATAKAFCDQLVAAGFPGGAGVATIAAYAGAGPPKSSDCPPAVGTGFALVLGEALVVQTSGTTIINTFSPPHF